MSISKYRINYLKLFSIYLFYNFFLKFIFFLLNDLIYVEYTDVIKRNLFFEWKADDFYGNIKSILTLSIFYDFIWLLPYTLMNIYIFIRFIRYLCVEGENAYQYIGFIILQVYLFWVFIYFCSIGFGFLITETYYGINGPLAPYGSFTITYLLLGNSIFILLFIPLWNKFLKDWVIKPNKL